MIRPHKTQPYYGPLGQVSAVETCTKGPKRIAPKCLQWKCACSEMSLMAFDN